jgi:alkylation response protein AidB-like acyl-CoA dehydrogenase
MAKSFVSEASHRVTLLNHQIHGGLGYCMDSDVHLFYRRAKAAAISFGDAAFHQKIIGKELAKAA